MRQRRFPIVGAEAGMGEADALAILDGHGQAGWVEIGFGESVPLKRRAIAELDSAAAGETIVPDFRQGRRIVVAKTAVFHHEAILSSGALPCAASNAVPCILLIGSQQPQVCLAAAGWSPFSTPGKLPCEQEVVMAVGRVSSLL